MQRWARAREVALHGSYFGHNFGDLLLMIIFHRWICAASAKVSVSLPLASDEMRSVIGAQHCGPASLVRASAVISGGGGYFGEQPHNPVVWGFRNLRRHSAPGIVARILRKPYAVVGVGVGPIT